MDDHWPCFHKHFLFSQAFLQKAYLMDISHNVKKTKQNKTKKKLRDVVSLRTEFFQFDTCGCQITRVPYQKEAQICNHLFLVYFFFFADTMLLLVPKHFLVIIQKQVVMKSGFVFLGVKYC